MTIQDMLKGLVKGRGLRKVAHELGIDHGQLYRSINSDLRLSTLQTILNLFGYDLKVVKRKEVSDKSKPSRSGREK
jgi:DNA-binding phage protein